VGAQARAALHTALQLRYAVRVVEDAGAVLFDQRRRTCHSLVVCYWAHLAGGVEALLGQLRHADALLDLNAGAPRAARRGCSRGCLADAALRCLGGPASL